MIGLYHIADQKISGGETRAEATSLRVRGSVPLTVIVMKDSVLNLRAPKSTNGRISQVKAPPSPQEMFDQLVDNSLILVEDVEALSKSRCDELYNCQTSEHLLELLTKSGLLTDYQAGRIEAGTTFGLILGNYRVLDRLGAGGMGVVFRAEHVRMRKQVAIKVMPFSPDHDTRMLHRFMTEIRAVAQMQHPNIVGAIDAGETPSNDSSGTILYFFVMEYVPGQDLEDYVRSHGQLSATKSCDIMHQIASALAEAHKHNLVHRDIKPSNILVTPEGQAKLLDFGLARKFSTSMTEPGTLLGTIDYMAPEQVQDAHSVDIRADLYGLGGVLYWCLTGQPPFPCKGNLVQELTTRITQQPPSVRAKRPDVPVELDQVIQKLMAVNPDQRYATPQHVMKALLPFLKSEMPESNGASPQQQNAPVQMRNGEVIAGPRVYQILIIDDEPAIRTFCKFVLQAEGMNCDEAPNGAAGLKRLAEKKYDLVVLDINMPDMNGTEVCKKLRENPPSANIKVIMASGNANTDAMAQMLLSGADDYITKPFSVVQLQSRVKASLRLKDAQDRSDILNNHLLVVNHELEISLSARDSDIVEARNALVLALAKLVEHRANENGSHLIRLQKYVRCLASQAHGAFDEQMDDHFIALLESAASLHDIGKVGLPDHILMKPGKLDSEERLIMQAHTLIGGETLAEVAKHHPSSQAFLQMAIDIVRHHHERFDGTGYPDRLSGTRIPLAARIVAICDVYDALRCRRIYKPALSHAAAIQVMSDSAGTQFDPALLKVFVNCSGQFERIYKENPD